AGDENGPRYVNAAAVIAHAQILAELDRRDDALSAIDAALAMGFGGEAIPQLAADLRAGKEIAFDVIREPAEGASEAVLLLAGALSREQADRRALVYTRVAQHMSPLVEEAALLAADILQQQRQYDLAAKEYAKIEPTSSLFDTAEIGRSDALFADEREDEAAEVLTALIRKSPQNADVRVALGDLYRRTEAFDKASVAYTDALDLLGERAGWFLYYSRGITFERTDRWDQAEADFRKALEIEPDQPLVLNYLGYSLVELRRNFDEALGMIETAVEQRPEDGYITDSLGWVLYRIGKFEEAVAPMERAVELAPIDPIINDHLGDVYWMVGRTLEAEFQWRRALSFEPEPEDAQRIRRKLEVGLDVVLAEEEAEAPVTETANDDG
ncbi:MAG: tetratricopeptide repeat protein, partial [Pseudomonadota bacterium]